MLNLYEVTFALETGQSLNVLTTNTEGHTAAKEMRRILEDAGCRISHVEMCALVREIKSTELDYRFPLSVQL